MIHGILQFTPSIAFCYVLHRCESLDIRCRESYNVIVWIPFTPHGEDSANGPPPRERHPISQVLGASRTDFCYVLPDKTNDQGEQGAKGRGVLPRHPTQVIEHIRKSFLRFDNDPSAGSPTETLLRLLLPLNDKVQWTSRDVACSEPLTSPRSEHFTGPFNR